MNEQQFYLRNESFIPVQVVTDEETFTLHCDEEITIETAKVRQVIYGEIEKKHFLS